MKRPQQQTHLTILRQESIEAMGVPCSECGETPRRLLVFYTARGGQRRTHNGSFCSKTCHDRFHGLRPK